MQGKVSRSDRLNAEFQKEIYDIISRRLKNPFVTDMFSVLAVETSRDLSHAKVYISIYSKNEEKKTATFEAIKADAKKIRYELAKVIRARTVPELHFFLDSSMEYGDKMDKLFKAINEGDKQ
jgi:ribosome-binding factor A